jgi:hypothetical protein
MLYMNLPLSDDLTAKVDKARGSVPRTRWIREAIEDKLAGGPSILESSMVDVPRGSIDPGVKTADERGHHPGPLPPSPPKPDPGPPVPPPPGLIPGLKAKIAEKETKPPSFLAHGDDPCGDPACPRFSCRAAL